MTSKVMAAVVYAVLWPLNRALMGFFVRPRFVGRERLAHAYDTPLILAANHVSYLDPLLIPAAIPFLSPVFPVSFMVRQPVFDYAFGLLGFILRALGCFTIHQEGDRRVGKIQDIRRARALLPDRTLGIFPEGSRSRSGQLGPFKRGVARLVAVADEVTVLPIAICGVQGISLSDFLLRRRRAILVIGEPIIFKRSDADGIPPAERYAQIIALLHARISTLLEANSSL